MRGLERVTWTRQASKQMVALTPQATRVTFVNEDGTPPGRGVSRDLRRKGQKQQMVPCSSSCLLSYFFWA